MEHKFVFINRILLTSNTIEVTKGRKPTWHQWSMITLPREGDDEYRRCAMSNVPETKEIRYVIRLNGIYQNWRPRFVIEDWWINPDRRNAILHTRVAIQSIERYYTKELATLGYDLIYGIEW